jgi:putative salt-induced outer membrane protein
MVAMLPFPRRADSGNSPGMRALLLAAVPLLLANADDSAPIPAPIQAMLDSAMASGNEGEVTTIAKYARTAAPDSADLITRITDTWREARRKQTESKLRRADFFDLVKGRAELGAYATTGNTRNIGVTAGVEVRREALEWRHKLRLQADYQESLGQVTRERYLAAYEPNWKFDERAYLYGAIQYESDRFSGFYDRFSVSTGAGYSAIKRPNLRLDLEVGPAFRHTRFTDATIESNVAARGSVDLDWKLNRDISIRQNASAYLQDANSTISSKSALLARLIGPLSAQLSYTLQYESMPPIGRQTTDTTSRAALVVDF